MRHQTLIELHSLIQDCLRKMTNDSYIAGYKYSFKLDWEKGTGTIQSPSGENVTNYYILKFYFTDRMQSVVGEEVVLTELYYPIKSDSTSEKQEEVAYKEFLLNSMRCMYNVLYISVWEDKQKEKVRPEDVTATDIVMDEIKAQSGSNKIITETGHVNSVDDLLKRNGISIKPKGKA